MAIIGSGLALFPIHNKFLTELATNGNGEVVFFLPAFGLLLLIMGSGLFILNNWDEVKAKGLGNRNVWIPMLVIIAAVGLSGIAVEGSVQDKFAPFGAGLALFALYIAMRTLGKDVFLPLAVGVGIASLGIIIAQFMNPGQATGGLVFERNYDVATGYILLGVALFYRRHQWLFALLAAIALLLSGSAEAAFAVGVVGIVILVRRDWSKRLVLALGSVAIAAIIFFGLGSGFQVHRLTAWSITGNMELIPDDRDPDPTRGTALDRRWSAIKESMTNIKPLGEGYILTAFQSVNMVHNVPLVIVQQLGWPGILAGIAWLWVSIWCLVKTKLKYAWALIIALCVFDHYIWTQLAPVWWMLVGLSTAGTIKSDLVFKGDAL